jgi:hypothetical protein
MNEITIDADVVYQVLEALESVEALIEHQYTGTREGMSYLQNTADDAYDALKALRTAIEEYRKGLLAPGGEPVGIATYMPGTSGFTMACFDAMAVPNETKLYTADQLAAAVEHWRTECRKLIRTYVIDDEAWNPEADTDKQMALRERSKA